MSSGGTACALGGEGGNRSRLLPVGNEGVEERNLVLGGGAEARADGVAAALQRARDGGSKRRGGVGATIPGPGREAWDGMRAPAAEVAVGEAPRLVGVAGAAGGGHRARRGLGAGGRAPVQHVDRSADVATGELRAKRVGEAVVGRATHGLGSLSARESGPQLGSRLRLSFRDSDVPCGAGRSQGAVRERGRRRGWGEVHGAHECSCRAAQEATSARTRELRLDRAALRCLAPSGVAGAAAPTHPAWAGRDRGGKLRSGTLSHLLSQR